MSQNLHLVPTRSFQKGVRSAGGPPKQRCGKALSFTFIRGRNATEGEKLFRKKIRTRGPLAQGSDLFVVVEISGIEPLTS